MLRFLRRHFASLKGNPRNLRSNGRWSRFRWMSLLSWLFCLGCLVVGLNLIPSRVQAQSNDSVQQQEDRVIREFALPSRPAPPPVYRPRPASPPPRSPNNTRPRSAPPPQRPAPPDSAPPDSAPSASSPTEPEPQPQSASSYQYILEFNRSPIVGNRLRLQGVYPQSRLGFTRPRNWQVVSAKALIRFQHSPSLLPDLSHLTVRVNDTSIGSIPLDRPESQISQVLLNIPPSLLQDYNDVSILAEQQTSDTCTNPANPALWTEILPDSKLILEFQPQAIALDFSRYPYPFLDDLSLDPDQLAYLRPTTLDESWLTAASRFQASVGRMAAPRSFNTRLVTGLEDVEANERLVIIGTPAAQPVLETLPLPFSFKNRQIVDGNDSVLPDDVGVLMLTTVQDSGVPVLVASGNGPEGVLKAVQFLVQSQSQQIGTGQALIVNNLEDIPSPAAREWAGFLPNTNTFQISELLTTNRQPFEDVTVRGTNAPPVQVSFKALPDDRFSRGSQMTLQYSYSPQVDPRVSTVEVRLDDVTVGAKRLTSERGGRDSLNVNLPDNLVTPNSQLNVQFILKPRESATCGLATDQQLWGTVHSDSSFNLKRENVVHLPDLKLLQTGFPLTAPQDLSAMAIALPDDPSDGDLKTLLALSGRMGRSSRADSIKHQVYIASNVPADVRNQKHLVGIGTRDRFPFPEVFESSSGFDLGDALTRQWQQSQVQTLPDNEGVVKEVFSPWNPQRVVLALTSQTDQGLTELQALFDRDQLFSQLRGDTALISRNPQNQSPYDPNAYSLKFLQESPLRQIEHTGFLSRISLFLRDNWFMLPTGMVLIALLLYGVSQLYLNRIAKAVDKSGDLK